MKQHFLIIGQGLAGSILAHTLIEHEQEVTVVDNAFPQSASRVAAGIINPLTGQRMVVADDVQYCLPGALAYYTRLGKQFQQSLYHPQAMLRLFNAPHDRDRLNSRKQDPRYRDYIGDEFAAGQSAQPINDDKGSFEQQQTGYLNIPALLAALGNYIRQAGVLIQEQFAYSDLQVSEDGVEWRGKHYDHVIFCEGSRGVNNRWFRWLPFQLSKGEVITVEAFGRMPDKIINRGYWLLPLNNSRAKIGASYQWDWLENSNSDAARDDLFSFAEQLLTETTSLALVDHKAGIRPTTKDRQPFMGTHPEYARLHCFNGFGSRGGLLIPGYAQLFLEYLLSQKPLPKQLNIQRFLDGRSLVVQARLYLSETIQSGDTVIDATVGNGHDTELLARCVGENGQVIGFDIQQQALEMAQRRLVRNDLMPRVTLIQDSHANMQQYIADEMRQKVSMVVFNLGFLPGSDKTCATQQQTTLQALKKAVEITKPKGSIVVTTYSGHNCGKNETKLVKQWVNELDKTKYTCQSIDALHQIDTPSLLIITKT